MLRRNLGRAGFRWNWPFLALCALLPPGAVIAFQSDSDPPAQSPNAGGEQEVVIKREALKLTDPKTYQVSLSLKPGRLLVLTAPIDGYVRTVSAKSPQKINQQAEAFRLDDRRSELILKRAKGALEAAKIERKIAQSKGDPDQLALAEARLESAQADVDLAELELDRLIIRAPFTGEIDRVQVVEGQFVRAGAPLATLSDSSRLVVEVPVERSAAVPGGTIEIKVEETAVKAKVEAVSALAAQFDALRELAISPASAIVSIDNASGKFSAGQTVYAELIPLAPVTLVPTVAISNVPDGNRKLQILRENVVRDLTVRILGKVGTDDLFVSGRFVDGDEVIVSSTRVLADGTPLRAVAGSAAGSVRGASSGQGGGSRADSAPAAGGARKPSAGF
jgi:membrane fusion protein (multidrug efflux system)